MLLSSARSKQWVRNMIAFHFAASRALQVLQQVGSQSRLRSFIFRCLNHSWWLLLP